MNSTYKHKHKKNQSKLRWGENMGSSTPVSLIYNGQSVPCDLCRQNIYTENIGTLGKSKVRSGLSSFFFGEVGEVLDTTSIITYFCNTCGLSKTIRNNDNIQIQSGPVLAAPVAVGEPAQAAAAPAAT